MQHTLSSCMLHGLYSPEPKRRSPEGKRLYNPYSMWLPSYCACAHSLPSDWWVWHSVILKNTVTPWTVYIYMALWCRAVINCAHIRIQFHKHTLTCIMQESFLLWQYQASAYLLYELGLGGMVSINDHLEDRRGECMVSFHHQEITTDDDSWGGEREGKRTEKEEGQVGSSIVFSTGTSINTKHADRIWVHLGEGVIARGVKVRGWEKGVKEKGQEKGGKKRRLGQRVDQRVRRGGVGYGKDCLFVTEKGSYRIWKMKLEWESDLIKDSPESLDFLGKKKGMSLANIGWSAWMITRTVTSNLWIWSLVIAPYRAGN